MAERPFTDLMRILLVSHAAHIVAEGTGTPKELADARVVLTYETML